MPNTIWLKGDGLVKERTTGGSVTPGHLVNLNTSGAAVVHAGAELNAFPAFALENDLVGKDIDTAIASGGRVQVLYPQPGAEINALLPANAAAVVVGDQLVSNGDGTLKKVTALALAVGNERRVVARALEAVNNSANGSPARIRVEVV